VRGLVGRGDPVTRAAKEAGGRANSVAQVSRRPIVGDGAGDAEEAGRGIEVDAMGMGKAALSPSARA